MPRNVFFSFHHARDNWRVPKIRNCGMVSGNFSSQPFLDKAEWEKLKRTSPSAVRDWIELNMKGASVVVVCFGAQTYSRPWVKYELEKAHQEGRGILAIDMHGLLDRDNNADPTGPNPLYQAKDGRGNTLAAYPNSYRTYRWIADNGYANISNWIDAAAKAVGR